MQKLPDGFRRPGVFLPACYGGREEGRLRRDTRPPLLSPGPEEEVEIGYLFERRFWHRGYATEAACGCRAPLLQLVDFADKLKAPPAEWLEELFDGWTDKKPGGDISWARPSL